MRHFEHRRVPNDQKLSLGKGIFSGRIAGQERKPPLTPPNTVATRFNRVGAIVGRERQKQQVDIAMSG